MIFGNSTAKAATFEIPANTKYVTRYSLGSSVHVPKITAYIDGLGAGVGTQTLRAVVYGTDDVLLGVSNEVTIIDNQAATWIDFSFLTNYPEGLSLPAGSYDIGLIGGPVANVARVYLDPTTRWLGGAHASSSEYGLELAQLENPVPAAGFETEKGPWAPKAGSVLTRSGASWLGLSLGVSSLRVQDTFPGGGAYYEGGASYGEYVLAGGANATAVPVEPGKTYTASVFIKMLAKTGTISGLGLYTRFTDAAGSSPSAWVSNFHSMTIGNIERIVNTATAPAGAAGLSVVVLHFTSAAASQVIDYAIDGVQVEEGSAATPFFDAPRRIAAKTGSSLRRNHVTNPSFEVDTATWQLSGAGITRVATDGKIGSACLDITANNWQYAYQDIYATTGNWTISWYEKTISHVSGTASSGGGIVIEMPQGGTYTYVSGDPSTRTNIGTTAWNRRSYVINVTSAGMIRPLCQINYGQSGTGGSGSIRFDGIMVEQGNTTNAYFDGYGMVDGTGTYVRSLSASGRSFPDNYTDAAASTFSGEIVKGTFEEDANLATPTWWNNGMTPVQWTAQTFRVETGWAASGTKSLRMTGTKDNNATLRYAYSNHNVYPGGGSLVPVNPGDPYDLYATFNVQNAPTASGFLGVSINFWTQAVGGQISYGGNSLYSTGIEVSRLKGIVPAGRVWAQPMIMFNSQTALDVVDFYVDEIHFTSGRTAANYANLANFATGFAAFEAPDRVDDDYLASLGYDANQDIFGSTAPLVKSTAPATVGWHGTRVDPRRGAYGVVQKDGALADFLGERVKVTYDERSVIVYVTDILDIDQDLSLSRRAFLALAAPSDGEVEASVEIMAASTDA